MVPVRVKDNGRGIPVEMHKKAYPQPESYFPPFMQAGKFDNDAYKTSGGLHGVGSSVVNALSEHMDVKVIQGRPTSIMTNMNRDFRLWSWRTGFFL
ncbi:MAG: ATP-binding protein [Enterocloster sp.]